MRVTTDGFTFRSILMCCRSGFQKKVARSGSSTKIHKKKKSRKTHTGGQLCVHVIFMYVTVLSSRIHALVFS